MDGLVHSGSLHIRLPSRSYCSRARNDIFGHRRLVRVRVVTNSAGSRPHKKRLTRPATTLANARFSPSGSSLPPSRSPPTSTRLPPPLEHSLTKTPVQFFHQLISSPNLSVD